MRACPRLLFAAPASGSGKTTVVCGFLEILLRRGLRPVSLKCGPDYIDPLFHRYVLGVPGCNLDSFFLDGQQVRELFCGRARDAEFAVLEGVMGYYDGVAGISTQASSYDISRITQTPAVLVLDAKKCSLSAAALAKGFLTYRPDSRICGVILNRSSQAMAERLRPFFEEQGLALFGYVPELRGMELAGRHLGLVLPGEQERLREKLSGIADVLERTLDIPALLAAGRQAPAALPDTEVKQAQSSSLTGSTAAGQAGDRAAANRPARRIAVALDEAFCFYYQENLDELRRLGFEPVFFSPLHDGRLPENVQAVLLGGGYPECYAEGLSENVSMRASVRGACADGIRILAECGGFLYLHEELEGEDGRVRPMAGVFPGRAFRTGKLSRFGYVTLTDREAPGRFIRAHEFHYWDSPDPGAAMCASKPLSSRTWPCMHRTETVLAGFPHLYYRSSPEFLREFLEGGSGA